MSDPVGFFQRVKRIIAQQLADLDTPIASSGAISATSVTDSGLTSGRVVIASTGGLLADDGDLTFSTDRLTATNLTVGTALNNTALTSGRVVIAGAAGLLADDSDLTFATATLSATNVVVATGLTNTALTSGRVVIASTAGLLADDSDLTFAGSTLTATGLAVGSGGATATGAITPNGGIVGTTLGRISNIPIGDVAYASIGTNTTPVSGTIYVAEVFLPANKTITGIGILNGATVGTDSGIAALYSSAGALLASSALAGAVTAGANAFQEFTLTAPYAAVGPAKYLIAYQVNGTTTRFRSIAVSTYLNFTISQAGVFGTLAAISPVPTATVADVGPVAYLF